VIDRIPIRLHELAAMPKASQRLLDDSAFDVEGWLAKRIASEIRPGRGGGVHPRRWLDKPRGFLTHDLIEAELMGMGPSGLYRHRGAGDFASANASDAIVDLVYALGATYRANAVFVMNSKTAGAVRKMKDADGRFLWSDGLAAGEPARLMGYPVLVAEDMPDIARRQPMPLPLAISARLHHCRTPRSARAARSVQRQTPCAVLCHQARGRGCVGFQGDQAAEIRHQLMVIPALCGCAGQGGCPAATWPGLTGLAP
jgi:hypothetical protein